MSAEVADPTTAIEIRRLLAGEVPVDSRVLLRGWVRTRRDSKAGMSFIHVHDGSCFGPLQVVAASGLSNYESEVLKLSWRDTLLS